MLRVDLANAASPLFAPTLLYSRGTVARFGDIARESIYVWFEYVTSHATVALVSVIRL